MKILYFVTVDWYFVSHRFELAKSMVKLGHDVVLVTDFTQHKELIEKSGITVVPLKINRSSKNIFLDLIYFFRFLRVVNASKPDVIHNVAMKPVLYGSIAASLAGVPRIVNALGGFGYLFTSRALTARLLKLILLKVMKIVFSGEKFRFIFQNKENMKLFVESKIVDKQFVTLIRGAGVPIDTFRYSPLPQGTLKVLLASRMIWDKGIKEYYSSAKVVKEKGFDVVFFLYGRIDAENPRAISAEQLKSWNEEGIVEWRGNSENMESVFASCSIVCLPTYYGEGVPKVLIEAAASGRPIITTNTPGCNDIVRDNINGILIPPRNPEALSDALIKLIGDRDMRDRMGRRGRELVEREFSSRLIIKQTIAIYEGKN